MRLDVSVALRQEGELLPFAAEVDASAASRDDAELTSASVHGQMAGVGERVALMGTIEAHVQACCARCTRVFETEVQVPYEAIFARPGEANADGEAGEDDPDLEFFEGSQVELDASVAASLSLNMPMRFLCEEDCKGLCPVCGVNRNETKCSCESMGEDSPFAALKSLLDMEDPNSGQDE